MNNLNLEKSYLTLIKEFDDIREKFSQFATKEDLLNNKQAFLNLLSECLLIENVTIRIAELFSPILIDLLSRQISRILSNSDTDFQHEFLCICLSKLIWHFPQVKSLAHTYFETAGSIFLRWEKFDEVNPFTNQPQDCNKPSLKSLLKAVYLFLINDANHYGQLCEWSMLIKYLRSEDPFVKCYAYKCIGIIINLEDNALKSFLKENVFTENLTDFTLEVLDLNQIWSNDYIKSINQIKVDDNEDGIHLESSDFSVGICNFSGVLLTNFIGLHECSRVNVENVVNIQSMSNNLCNIALGISSGKPVLIRGPVGCGKTLLLHHLANVTRRKPFVYLLHVQMGEHIDSKALIGNYCCTELSGDFIWNPGPLTQAMINGYWLVLEDIDYAPMDVVSVLVSVLQSNMLVLPGHAKPIKAAPGFHLFATQRLLTGPNNDYIEFKNNAEIIDKLWFKVMVDPLLRDELTTIINTRWPMLKSLCNRILDIYSLFSCDIASTEEQDNYNDAFNLSFQHGRFVSTRDLFKLCDRLKHCISDTSPDKISDVSFFHALNCFCDNIPKKAIKIAAARSIAIKFTMPPEKASYFYNERTPEIIIDDECVNIGRATLKIKPSFSLFRDQELKFACTQQASIILEGVAHSIFHKEPVLLVGETGTGKTSIIQYLAQVTKTKLIVVNMSQQSDVVDLIGGYKPVDFKLILSPIKETYENLFPQTFSKVKNTKFLGHITNCFYSRRYKDLISLMKSTQGNAVKIKGHYKYTSLKSMD